MIVQFILITLMISGFLAVEQLEVDQKADLTTRWAETVSSETVHPEYPRPQMAREAWLNLNGVWQYALTTQDADIPQTFEGDILVPFPVESQLSGVQRSAENRALWYERTFTIPHDWTGEYVLLHFGAVDWEATVWVNGTELGTHRGGYTPFSFDVTEALNDISQPQIITLRVTDPTDTGHQARGKQVNNPQGIWYTPTTGIWQTVWLEPVPQTAIRQLYLTPDLDNQQLEAVVHIDGPLPASALIRVMDGETVVSEVTTQAADSPLTVTVPVADPKLWSPDSPFLYDVEIALLDAEDQIIDQVDSYFGMRKISVEPDANGDLRLFLNNEPIFQLGMLDQGFWPDGLYTAPSDEALRYDIEITRALGFNTIRKHVKIEPERWYYWADKLGVLVWQDMPNGDAHVPSGAGEITRSPESAAQFEYELEQLVQARFNHPSIIMWVPFNEGWGQYDTARITAWVKQLDPSRLVNNTSGWNDQGVGDVFDIHAYPGPQSPPADGQRARVLGEFGGLGLPLVGHTWQDEENWGYRQYNNADELTAAYADLITNLRVLIEKEGLAAAIYTQTTDVEIEVNGMLTYDRAIVKMGTETVHDINSVVYAPVPQRITLAPAATTEAVTWQYTTQAPSDDTWMSVDFDATGWQTGEAGFGLADGDVSMLRTTWDTPQIWLRQTFTIDELNFETVYLRIHHIEDAVVYLNGEELMRLPLSTQDYVDILLTDEAMARLQPGINILAVHASEPSFIVPTGPLKRYIDVGLYAIAPQQ